MNIRQRNEVQKELERRIRYVESGGKLITPDWKLIVEQAKAIK